MENFFQDVHNSFLDANAASNADVATFIKNLPFKMYQNAL